MLPGRGPTFQYFADHFGFNERETVTILGAHTLGMAQYEFHLPSSSMDDYEIAFPHMITEIYSLAPTDRGTSI